MKQDPLEQSESLTRLAERLALNNINISLWDLIEEGIKNGTHSKVYEDILADVKLARRTKPRRERNIVIVGAGASKNACAELPTGKEAIEKILKKFERKGGKRLLKNEFNRLEQVYRLPSGDFETVLYGISRFYPEEIKKELFDMYECSYNPNLAYEIIAHLFKHRFIDVIINFNFDELLDQAIADELNPDEYQRIISDGEYNEDLIFDNGRLRYPVYIKPHGSVSHKSSMRFTREDYFGLPADIEEAIKNLINPNSKKNKGSKIRVNFIVVGFNMQSFEFNLLLNEVFFKEKSKKTNQPAAAQPKTKRKAKSKAHFFFLQTSIKDAFFEEKEFPGNLKEGIEDNATWIEVSREKPSLDKVFEDLWNLIDKQFKKEKDPYPPRNIDRHKLIATIFKNDKRRKADNSFEYLQDRTLVEFALSVAKYMGFVCIEQLISDRFGKYFNLLQRSAKGAKNLDFQTMPAYCKFFKLEDYGYGNSTFYWADTNAKATGNLTKTPPDFVDKFFPDLFKRLKKNIKDSETRKNLKSNEELFRRTIETLVSEEDIEISPVYEHFHQNVFKSPRPVKTKLALDYYTRHFLKKRNFNKILVVAETGEWLLDLVSKSPNTKSLRGKEVHLIIADTVKRPEEHLPGSKVKTDVLRWWMHNQHMTVFLKKLRNKKLRPLQGIYFSRRQRSTHINPVILTHPEDLKIIIGSFAAYIKKSRKGFKGEVPLDFIKKYLAQFDFGR